MTQNTRSTVTGGRMAGRHARRAALVLAAGMTAMLAGCANHSKHHFEVGGPPASHKQRHPIVIGEREQTLDIPVGTSVPGLPKASREAVTGFAQDYARNPSGPIRIMMPTGSHNAHVASALGSDILEALSHGGVDPARVEIMHYDASRHGRAAPIRLSYQGITASVHKCGRWDKDLTRTGENRNWTNFGCANQANMAAIVANPADLLSPRGQTSIDGADRARKIKAYQDGSATTSGNDVRTAPATFGDG